MAQRRRVSAEPRLRSASNPVYSYLVSVIGSVEEQDLDTRQARIAFRGSLAKKDGHVREHLVVIENSVQQPFLVDRLLPSIRHSIPTRMLVSFEREMVPDDNGLIRLQVVARVEEVVSTDKRVDGRQLSLGL